MELPADRVGALAFRAWVGAYEKSDCNTVGICTRWKAGINFYGREMSCIYFLDAQQSHKELGRKVIGW